MTNFLLSKVKELILHTKIVVSENQFEFASAKSHLKEIELGEDNTVILEQEQKKFLLPEIVTLGANMETEAASFDFSRVKILKIGHVN